MIARYTRPQMASIWSEENKYRNWLRVELAATDTLVRAGMVPAEAATALHERSSFTVERIHEIEAETRHDVLAFTQAVAESVGPEARWLHYGLTSTDVVDTAQALALTQASEIIRSGILRLREVLRKRAIEFQHTPTIGRTHGVHAEPTTFGMKLLLWYSEMGRNLKRFDAAAEDLRVGKISGAVGAFGKLKPEHEEDIVRSLGLKHASISTQVLQRDRHAAYITTLAVLCSTLDKIATEIRHLQRTEVREAEEFFSAGQKGSSAMPHKRNPITCENISGLARVVRGNAQVALENVALWHERDISHSSAERVILPDTTIIADYLLDKAATLIEKLLVYPARMLKNLESTGGLIYSGQLLIDLAAAGMTREEAYRLVQSHAMNAWQNELNYRELIMADPEINKHLSPEKLAAAFDVNRQLSNIDTVFARVLAEN
ncbi:adenylosuccinate lyase [Granulicella mallensis]|uniref:Adenylosuccinate lyase n=1 Tax=Granulicella mallensis (strain ATCC BAA-1857 / DSM 23137 / MP5ACTX8) TaxID=682795 RepID=G8NY14_GRAMM|nr:adenylosuccinate lyase [Granulicella mallensis]AEU35602.1 adenylosuccinate lyase [Granulicella mallensis MP5ACTX8]